MFSKRYFTCQTLPNGRVVAGTVEWVHVKQFIIPHEPPAPHVFNLRTNVQVWLKQRLRRNTELKISRYTRASLLTCTLPWQHENLKLTWNWWAINKLFLSPTMTFFIAKHVLKTNGPLQNFSLNFRLQIESYLAINDNYWLFSVAVKTVFCRSAKGQKRR